MDINLLELDSFLTNIQDNYISKRTNNTEHMLFRIDYPRKSVEVQVLGNNKYRIMRIYYYEEMQETEINVEPLQFLELFNIDWKDNKNNQEG